MSKKKGLRRKEVPLPSSPQSWLDEIARAYLDAAEAIPFAPLVGASLEPKDLFHLAPAVTLKSGG